LTSRWLLIEGDALEPFEWEELDDKTNNELEGTDNNTEDVLIGVQSLGFDDLTSEFNHEHLDDNGENCDVDEKWVSEHTIEDVQFFFELSRVELVENLHENEGLEDVGEVDEFLGSVTWWLLHWGVVLLFDVISRKEIVITFEFFFRIFGFLLEFMPIIWFFMSVEFANILGQHFLVEISGSKSLIINFLFFPPFNFVACSIVLLGIEWVVFDAFLGVISIEFQA